MKTHIFQLVLFVLAFTLQVRIVDAKEFSLPAEEPRDCVRTRAIPCAVTTGDTPRMITWEDSRWELDRNLVINIEKQGTWNLFRGLLVIDSQQTLVLHTPFADIHLGKSKAMIHVLEDKVRVLALNGEGVKVNQKGDSEIQFLVPGFQNWYGGLDADKTSSGVATVIDIHEFSQKRAAFFLNHQHGFPLELREVASRVKWAAKIAADIHKGLVERKIASYDEKTAEEIRLNRQKIEFNKYLRRLFLKKINYDF